MAHTNRRKRPRVRVQWPVQFEGGAGGIRARTEDLSSNGFYCIAPMPFVADELRGCVLSIPSYEPGNPSGTISVECRVRIVRVEALREAGMYGIGCCIEEYSVPSESAPFSDFPPKKWMSDR